MRSYRKLKEDATTMTKLANIGLRHDWTFETWPPDVYPYDGKKARHVVRQNQSDLLKCGALARPGQSLVIFGAGYAKWLASKASRVAELDVAANRPEHAHKRFGQAGIAGRAKADSDAA